MALEKMHAHANFLRNTIKGSQGDDKAKAAALESANAVWKSVSQLATAVGLALRLRKELGTQLKVILTNIPKTETLVQNCRQDAPTVVANPPPLSLLDDLDKDLKDLEASVKKVQAALKAFKIEGK